MASSPRTKAKQLREPPPSLFLGPPSQNASHVSLSSTTLAPVQTGSSTRTPLIRQRSNRIPSRGNLDGPSEAIAIPRNANVLPRQQQEHEGKKQADRTDALWAEMQSTLEEVELSAVNGTHVFGPEHSRALESLREAQIGLAQAWARSEADDAVENKEPLDGEEIKRTETVASGTGTGRPGSSGVGAERREMASGTRLEEETEADILLARRRREANDKYFSRVNTGVLDVVAKLQEVAIAMRAVEQESRDIWGENESVTGTASFHS
ncbi:hypothetical protein BP6252_12214 [Coleophoma cylindrospora]|uniref:Uncharacterized protein n=1 Tax=Coleophoma cylindrospora TaxID=1849047 RepID=A0A3D8QGI4_9HELO|nr:hypothetical protein BP6252_12214 [Coleophoma cylindrospora]